MSMSITTHILSKENFILDLIQNCHDDNCVSPWVRNVMQSFPDNKHGQNIGDTKMKGTKPGYARFPASVIERRQKTGTC